MLRVFVILQLLLGREIFLAELTPILVMAFQMRHVLLVPQEEFVTPWTIVGSRFPGETKQIVTNNFSTVKEAIIWSKLLA